jgi:hypothetical protein
MHKCASAKRPQRLPNPKQKECAPRSDHIACSAARREERVQQEAKGTGPRRAQRGRSAVRLGVHEDQSGRPEKNDRKSGKPTEHNLKD